MGTSISTILAPADQLRDLLFTPRFIDFCAFFAYEGLRNGVSLTHVGMRKGIIAKVYGAFYLLACLVSLWTFPSDIKKFLAIDPANIRKALLLKEPLPKSGFIFIGLAFLMFLFTEWLIRYRRKNRPSASKKLYRIQSGRKFLNWMIAFPLTIGLETLMGFPYWVNVGVFAFFMYFAPFTSPKELMKTMRFPNEKHSNVKSVSSTENVG